MALTRFVTREWRFTAYEPERAVQLSVVVNFDVLTDNVVASAVGPITAAALSGKLQRDKYTNGNGGTSTRFRVVLSDGTALDWDRKREDAIDRLGTAAIHKALGR
jgi:hypothetical protein